jgi:hypothetical protein
VPPTTHVQEVTNDDLQVPHVHVVEPRTKGGKRWKDLTIVELRTWLGILIMMEIKREPSKRNYWSQSELLQCQVIPRVMLYRRWEEIMRCLHLVVNASVVRDSKQPGYDKIAKCHWLVTAFRKHSRELYYMGEFLTVDELIVPYKGRYCRIRQFLQNKPIGFGIKIWALCDSQSRYCSDIIVYEGKGSTAGEEGMGHQVVTSLYLGLENRWHTIVCDNLFSSPRLFHDLMANGFWAT